jgi:urease accessory protein
MNPPLPTLSQSSSWRILQIADSAFPTGGFAHSAGLEAAMALGEVGTTAALDTYVASHLWNAGHGAIPFVGAAHDRPADVLALCAWFDATLTNHVANRASRTQARAFLATCAQVFAEPYVVDLAARARRREGAQHLAPVFGAVLYAIGVSRHDTLALHLHLALRGIASAAVRLGAVGPLEAQRLQLRHGATLDAVLAQCRELRPEDAAIVAPLHDIYGATHDALYARLFQS